MDLKIFGRVFVFALLCYYYIYEFRQIFTISIITWKFWEYIYIPIGMVRNRVLSQPRFDMEYLQLQPYVTHKYYLAQFPRIFPAHIENM